MASQEPLVSIIIVHYNNRDYLRNCIRSLIDSTYKNIELIVVDNGFPKLSPSDLNDVGLDVHYIPSEENRGFGDGCNQGIKDASGEFVFLLNNDIEIDKNCISELMKVARLDPAIAVVQPKMLDLKDKRYFHSSAAGGMIDIFGYPFARGRIFDQVEEDKGQYDTPSEIFWASGAAILVRKDIFDMSGYFDPYYFMYMEEIDLIWRIHLLGTKRTVFAPSAKIFHFGCPNLERDTFRRMYYVHRNSLIMLITNYSVSTLLFTLPVRLILETAIALGSLLLWKPRRTAAVLMSFGYILGQLPLVIRKRTAVQSRRRVNDRYILSKMYKRPILLMHLLGYNKVSQLAING